MIIATKSLSRSKADMAADIDQALRHLRTDYIDLFQLHNVHTEDIWRQVMAPDGALAALKEARQSGKIRHIGVTTHSRDMALRI
ncbi:MAG: aldo/keto reductase, partial [Candidatus Oleimicrobiaceae bacterium]